jgi:hypothetical protein
MLLHKRAVLGLQEVKDDEELREVSQKWSILSSARAHTFAKAWIALDK